MTSISQTSKVSEAYAPAQVQKTTSTEAVTQSAEAAVAQDVITTQRVRGAENNADAGHEENKGKASNEALKDAVEKINKESATTEAVFGIHEKTNRVTIKIVDKETKKVVKEFPPEKTLDLIAKAWEMAGIMVDEKR